MLYRINAKYNLNLVNEFFKKLTDGTMENQKPDGLEIISSMKRAKLQKDKSVEWYENCFCEVPLNHERTTVYDTYFYDFETTLMEELKDDIVGDSFWEFMQKS